jgi:DNA-binding beta-propeller fold protein YncE
MTTTSDTVTSGLDDLLSPPTADNGGAGGSDGSDGSGGGGEGGGTPAAPAPEDSRRKLKIALIILLVLLLILGALFAWYLITRKPLSQLPGLSQEAMPHYATSFYGVDAPLGVAVSQDGSQIYVTQSTGKRVVAIFDAEGNQTGTMTPPKSMGIAHIPTYLAVNPKTGQVWVTDRLATAVYVYTSNGAFVKEFVPPVVSKTWQPLGIAFDNSGRLFVSDVSTTKHRVLVFDESGKLTATLTARPDMLFPNGMATDAQGDLAVADANNGRLLVFDSSGKQSAAVNRGVGNGDLGLPRGVAFDSDGRLFVVDTTNQAVNVYRLGEGDKAGTVTFVGQFGDQGIEDGMFMYPNGVATDQHGRVYVTDRANNRLQVWSF